MNASPSPSASKKPLREETMLNEEQRSLARNSASNCLVAMPQFIQSPFFRQTTHLKPNFHLLATTATHVVGQLHSAIVSTADRFFNLLQIWASENPIINKLLSFSCHLQSFRTQVPCRNSGTLGDRFNHNFAAILPGDSVAGVVVTNGILSFLNIYNTLLIVRLVLTWFPNAPPAIVSPLSTLCDPYLNIFRGIIPPLGGTLDFSPILAFLVLNAVTSTAAALPAELPDNGEPQNLQSNLTQLTTSQRKWMRRVAGNKSKSQSGEN